MVAMTPPGSEQQPTHAVATAVELADLSGRLRRSLRAGVRRAWPYDQLSTAQLDLLRLLVEQESLSVSEAAGHLGVAGNTVSTLVRQLADAGLVLRRPDAADRRVGRLRASASAVRRLRRWRGIRDDLLSDAMATLDPADRRALAGAVEPLRRLVAALEQLPG
jgi:DNA-binding MarR family transcriptional regulator